VELLKKCSICSELERVFANQGAEVATRSQRKAFFYPLVHGRTNLAILIELGVRFQEVRVERRVRVSGFDDGDANAPRAQLVVERLEITFSMKRRPGVTQASFA
jgi:hypothetical protein